MVLEMNKRMSSGNKRGRESMRLPGRAGGDDEQCTRQAGLAS